jgi:formylglycine-generating enzyme required for sulfatase activity/TolB-like protein
MKNKCNILLFFIALAFSLVATGAVNDKETVAVYVTGGREEGANDILSASLKEAITKSKDYVAVERTTLFLQQLQKEQKYQMSGNVDYDIARLGKQSGAKYVCVAEIMSTSSGDFVTARLIGVESASVVATADGAEKITDIETLMHVSETIATQLVQDAAQSQSSKSKECVAVYVSGIGDEEETNKILGIKLVSAITKSVQYAAMERTDAFLKQLRNEQDYQTSGNVDDSQLAALGKQFGVQYVCAAKVSKAYGSKVLTASLIDVETAQVIVISKAALSSSDINSLISVTQKISKDIAGKTVAEVEAEAKAKAKEEAKAREKAETEAKMEAIKKQAFESITQNMVYVQGGTFTMGCTFDQESDCDSDEKPSRRITVNSFHISKYEVTQGLWEFVMENNPSFFKGYNRPVECVSWDDVQEFIHKLNAMTGKNYRLPTEAEWEYAARGGMQSRNYKYSGSNIIDEVAWYYDNSGSETHSVGTKKANELGIYDMSGNVYEWCQDWYDKYSKRTQINPQGSSNGSNRVIRGGNVYFNENYCRVANRHRKNPNGCDNDIGFRVVLP